MYVSLVMGFCKHVELGLRPSQTLSRVHPWVAYYIVDEPPLGGQSD